MKDYSALRGILQPGDLVLYHYPGFNFVADAIEWFEGDGEVSHNSICVSADGYLVDVLLSGIEKTHISKYQDNKTEIIVRRIHGITPDLQKAMAASAVQEIGRGYSIRKVAWKGLILLLQKIGLGGWFVKNNPFRREIEKTCSGSYARIAEYSGYVVCPGKVAENVTPQDLLESLVLDTVLSI